MYEEQTFDAIMQRMLERIPDTLDKRESSPVYMALAPAAVELASLYVAFDCMLAETFGDTASREYLIRLCADRYHTQDSYVCGTGIRDGCGGAGRNTVYRRRPHL